MVIPFDPGIFSWEALTPLKTLLKDMETLDQFTLDQFIVVLSRYRRSRITSALTRSASPSHDLEMRLRSIYDSVFIVPESDAIYHSQQMGLPLSHVSPDSKAAKAYAKIVDEIQSVTPR